jgi:hypothetical protein
LAGQVAAQAPEIQGLEAASRMQATLPAQHADDRGAVEDPQGLTQKADDLRPAAALEKLKDGNLMNTLEAPQNGRSPRPTWPLRALGRLLRAKL